MSDTTQDKTTSPWNQRGFIVSALVVALVVALGVIFALTRLGDDDADPKPQVAPATGALGGTPASAAPAASGADPGCGLPAGDQTIPASAPPTRWELVGTMAAPTSPDMYGPGRVVNGIGECYARTPVGALYAAARAAAATTDPQLRLPLVKQMAADTPGRAAALQLLAQPGNTDSGGGVQIAGYSIMTYDEQNTIIDLALRVAADDNSTGYVHLPVSLQWERADWRLVVPSGGDLTDGIQAIPDLTGYVPWSGA